jgi:hypothetical protein
MMEASQSLPELIAIAQSTVKTSEARVSETLALMDSQSGSDAQRKELCAATVEIELAAVDIFSLFEARMQHHFKRGPFSRKLKSLLLEAGQADLANRVHQYYLLINVLKHGKGASYRELLNDPSCLFVMKSTGDIINNDARPSAGLVDVNVSGFFDGLTKTILEAYRFLENR